MKERGLKRSPRGVAEAIEGPIVIVHVGSRDKGCMMVVPGKTSVGSGITLHAGFACRLRSPDTESSVHNQNQRFPVLTTL